MRKRILLSISVVAIAIFLVIFYFNIYEVSEQTGSAGMMNRPGMPFQMPIPFEYRMWLSPVFLIIAIVPISYYLISKKLENNMKVMLKIMNKNGFTNNKKNSVGINKEAILKFLNSNERRVLEKLMDKKGKTLQSEISRMKGMNKLKTHRAIKNLEMKGVIKTESYGKTKQIILSKDIKNILLK